ncbi:hypothetical protein SK128_026353, partial [Halocaridina rubra]
MPSSYRSSVPPPGPPSRPGVLKFHQASSAISSATAADCATANCIAHVQHPSAVSYAAATAAHFFSHACPGITSTNNASGNVFGDRANLNKNTGDKGGGHSLSKESNTDIRGCISGTTSNASSGCFNATGYNEGWYYTSEEGGNNTQNGNTASNSSGATLGTTGMGGKEMVSDGKNPRLTPDSLERLPMPPPSRFKRFTSFMKSSKK